MPPPSALAVRRTFPLLGRMVNQSLSRSTRSVSAAISQSFGAASSPQPLQHQQHQRRSLATGSKGARGHGWLKKYREGRGGRHLQGRWHDRDVESLNAINDKVFALSASAGANSNGPTKAYLSLSVGGAEAQRVVIELASTALPKTCDNFTKLCMNGIVVDASDRSAENWGYKGTNVHKIEKTVGLCMGDVLGLNGDGGRCHPSLWSPGSNHPNAGAYTIADEAHVISHTGPGIVTMLSTGVHENDSRFLITTTDAPQLDGRFVAFGRVVEGMDAIEDIHTNIFTKRGRPTVDIEVVECGVL